MKLYSYCVRSDSGFAPNPYWGICTLVLCKPAIRRTAEVGDWVVGLGSVNSPCGDTSGRVVYAMQVTGKMTMEAYDQFCRERHANKLPKWFHREYARRMGDCLYDYSDGYPPKLRAGVHKEENREHDLGGKFALISRHFYYFGSRSIELPESLRPIIHARQGHKSEANGPYAEAFVKWIEGRGYRLNVLHGQPQLKKVYQRDPDVQNKCSRCGLEEEDGGR